MFIVFAKVRIYTFLEKATSPCPFDMDFVRLFHFLALIHLYCFVRPAAVNMNPRFIRGPTSC